MSVARAETGLQHTCERCGRTLPKKPQGGRPYRFCPDSADEPGTSCLDLDKRERVALDRAGLGELVSAFRTEREALAADVAPLRAYAERVDALETLVRQIAEVAVARADQAEQDRLHAEAARRAAERDTREAEQRTTRAYELRDEALADRDRAVEDEKTAKREADAAVTRALTAEHARGQAQGIAEERARALQDEQQRRQDAERETTQLREQLLAAEREVTRVTGALADAGHAQADQERLHQEQQQTTAAHLAEVRAELGRTQDELRTAAADRDALRTRAEVLATGVEDGQRRLEALRGELAEVRADSERRQADLTHRAELAEQRHRDLTATAEQQQAAADTRHQDLLTALAAGRFPAAPAQRDSEDH